jgi:hypothetical protein
MSSWVLRVFGVLLLATALGLALSRAPDRPVETLVARWAPAPSDFMMLSSFPLASWCVKSMPADPVRSSK